MTFLRISAVILAATAQASAQLLPLAEIKPGQRGTGHTVFSGSSIETFDVEVLGVLENVGPKQSVILAKLSGGPLTSTGVMQGMSGSPVYIGGKLAGAVAFSFPFSKEPIAGIRPIQEMLVAEPAPPKPARVALAQPDGRLLPDVVRREIAAPGFGSNLTEISTPISFGGFTARTLEHFAPQLRSLGFEPRQGTSSGASPGRTVTGDISQVRPGSMISVQLLSGDVTAGADGTVTHVDGKRIYAFGHRFLSAGTTELPFARAEVLALLPSISSSFKISAAREWMGTITDDRSTVVAGELGRRARMIPVSMAVSHPGGSGRTEYNIEMVRDRFLSPFLFQMALFSAIDATERGLGDASFSLRGEIKFSGSTPPVRLDNFWAGDFAVSAVAAFSAAAPLAYVMQSNFADANLESIRVEVEAHDRKKQLQIEQVWAANPTVRPGETLDVSVLFTAEGGAEVLRKVQYTTPVGAPPGSLNITVSDSMTANFTEYRTLLTTPPRTATQMIAFLNGLRKNSGAYVRFWRPNPGYQVQGEELPAPPPSISLVLARSHGSIGQTAAARNAKVAEIAIPLADYAVAGAKTVQVEVKE